MDFFKGIIPEELREPDFSNIEINPDSEDENDELAVYRNGGDGFVRWAEENVRVPIQYGDAGVETWVYLGEMPEKKHPITGRSFKYFWEKQKEQLVRALEMHNGHFKHRIIVFCEPRGDGKSYRAMLIQAWKFCCFPRQLIVLGANSKEQTKFVHFDIIRKMILNSPNLVEKIGRKNVQDKEIKMRNAMGETVSFIRPISTMQGIVSNITGYTFSEMFKMKDTTFFTELHGSIRNIPNALGVIDSTVSTKSHKLYELYDHYIHKRSTTLFFCYRYSKEARQEDYWHPNQTQEQLNNYQIEFGPEDFDRFFKNTWESGQGSIITKSMIQGIGIVGINGKISEGTDIISILDKINACDGKIAENILKDNLGPNRALETKMKFLQMRLNVVDTVYSLNDNDKPRFATFEELNRLSELYKTDWTIGAGVDRADPLKKSTEGANTIVTISAKGLMGSRGVDARTLANLKNPSYIYPILGMFKVASSDIEDIKDIILEGGEIYDGIDTLCCERWGMWDVKTWCEDEGIEFEPVFPTYSLQRDVFREIFTLLRDCRIKSPKIHIMGAQSSYIFEEELDKFTHDLDKRFFGSPEKDNPSGVQDDSMYSHGYSIYGMRNKTFMDFRQRTKKSIFATYFPK